jgi:hypothetical protein
MATLTLVSLTHFMTYQRWPSGGYARQDFTLAWLIFEVGQPAAFIPIN